MSQSPLHRTLVSALVSHLARGGVDVTHAAGVGTLADPPKIGRHEPDVLGDADGRTIIGEAKTGQDLSETATKEQLADFTAHLGEDGERATFWLAVPDGWRDVAQAAIVDAGGELHDAVDILTVSLPDAPVPPTRD